MQELDIPLLNAAASDYVRNDDRISGFFDYPLHDPHTFSRRLEELAKRDFPREQLTDHLLDFNRSLSCGPRTVANIEKLKNPDAVAVIAGQQAGLLTGPLFTIHKTISVIRLARQIEEEHGVPAVPVFWTAGEDHDLDEVNHVYVMEHSGNTAAIKKRTYPADRKQNMKIPISERQLDKWDLKNWVDGILSSYGETVHTRELLSRLEEVYEYSGTYVTFFSKLMLELFNEDGLVLLDSNHPDLRKIEKPFFKKLIESNADLRNAVKDRFGMLADRGYSDMLGSTVNSSHLFYHLDGERILLEPKGKTFFCGKQNECLYDMDELVQEADRHPERLSNNVVSRPLMQEFLFPVAAFVGGPGEIAYWAGLKDAFHLFGFNMPPVIPRLSMTMIDRNIERYLGELELPVTDVIQSGTDPFKGKWLEQQRQEHLEDDITTIKKEIDNVHASLRTLAQKVDPTLKDAAMKNGKFVQGLLGELEKKMERAIERKYEIRLLKYDHAGLSLRPNEAPQERIWTAFYYLNRYGFDFASRLASYDYEWNGRHKLIYI